MEDNNIIALTTPQQVIDMVQAYWNDEITRDVMDNIFFSYLSNPDDYRKQNSSILYSSLIKIIFSKDVVKDFYYMMSALFRLTMIPDVLHELIRSCTEDSSLSKEMKHFAHYQCLSYKFLYPDLNTPKTRELLDNLYEKVYQEYIEETKDLFNWIPLEKRNKDFVIVITSQVLGLNHGPTKTLLDRCYTINTKLNKQIYIINTADALTFYGIIDWFDTRIGNYESYLCSYDNLNYKGRSFPFFQCINQMPQVPIIREIMNIVISEKPKYIVAIGGTNITADLCSHIVPVLSITLGPSERTQTRTTFQMTGHKIDSEDRLWLSRHDLPETHIIEGLFTSTFKPQTSSFSRIDLGLSEDGVICLVVGARLDTEVDDRFIDVVLTLAQNDIYTAFMGDFFDYEQRIQNNKLLKKYTRNLGFQDDALAVCECCDIYINPKRLGGGTSAAEALFKGLPVVTLNYGDVAIGAGDNFCVNDYDEMCEHVIKLATDKKYYKEMSDKAIERASLLTDTDKEFTRIIKEMESRHEFM